MRNDNNYEKECEKIKKRNDKLLKEFEQHLYDSGLSEKTVKKHVENVDFYINEFLLYYDAITPADGIIEVESFFADWLPRKVMWASKTAIKDYGAGLKKFYAFMGEKGYIDADELDGFSSFINDEMPRWLKNMEMRDSGEYFDNIPDFPFEDDDAYSYPLDNYLADLEPYMETLHSVVARDQNMSSFDFLHGMACCFAILPGPFEKSEFAGIITDNVLGTIEEKKQFETALAEFAEHTQEFVFSDDFMPYCNGWDYYNVNMAHPAEWCKGFMAIFLLLDEILYISKEQLFEYFQEDVVPLSMLSVYGNDEQTAELKEELVFEDISYDEFIMQAYDNLIVIPESIAEKAEELYEKMLERQNAAPAVSEKVGRNDLCPCGSGKKYKKCCGK